MENQSSNSALLVMDMQQMLLQTFPGAAGVIENVQKAIAHARSNNIPVIYVIISFREGFPELSTHNKRFSSMSGMLATIDLEKWNVIEPSLAPVGNEPVVLKKRYSAFSGSDLDLILRSGGINHLILCGVATRGVVLSTLTEASDKDYQLTVLSDACKDRDEEVHSVLMEKIFPAMGDVMTTSEWVKQ